jgi:cytochrome oxidase Cu insertion factor (SCO1/SenC/PrrC family)
VKTLPAGDRLAAPPPRAMPRAVLALLAGVLTAHAAIAQVSLRQLPQAWRDDSGQEFPLGGLLGHRVVLTMAYAACHRICPMTLEHLQEMQTALDQRGEQADFVVIGYDPAHERPAVWKAYRREHGLTRDNWHFLTGSRSGTLLLAHMLNFEDWQYDEHVMHDSRAVLFDARGAQQATVGPDAQNWLSAL